MKMKVSLPLTGFFLAGCVFLTGCATETYTVATPPPGPSVEEVQAMVQAHVSDGVIVNQIQNSSTRYQLTVGQIIALKNAGASDTVLNALINTASKPVAHTTNVVNQPANVYPYPYAYPYVYVNPWPWGWWGGPYYGGYYRGGWYRR